MQTLSKIARSKIFDLMLTFMGIIMMIAVAVSVYWWIKPYEVIVWNIDEFEMQKETYEVGEPLTYRTAFCKYGKYEAKTIYTIVDGVTYLLPTKISRADEGCADFVSSTITTPNIASGVYHIEVIIVYQVNPLKEVEYHFSSNDFNINNPSE